jgi:methylenetetrahydrofolate reductase (NADPH)
MADLLRRTHFEVFPVDGVEDELARFLPLGTVIHVMCMPDEGADRSVDVALRIAEAGFNAVPHLASRTVSRRFHLEELVARMREGGITGGFFPGGDGVVDPQHYESAVELIADLGELDHGLTEIGVAAYPESHRAIPRDKLLDALLEKQKVATFMSSENCFQADAIVSWLRELRGDGVTLPLLVGVPGVVPIRRLVDAMKEYGLGSALRYLRKQHGMVAAVARGKFAPDPLLRALIKLPGADELGIDGVHVFTFQEIAATARWWDAERTPETTA